MDLSINKREISLGREKKKRFYCKYNKLMKLKKNEEEEDDILREKYYYTPEKYFNHIVVVQSIE